MLLSTVTGIHPRTRTFQPSEEFVDPYCVVGIELEYENISRASRLNINSEYWRIEEDHSLRNSGVEFISQPIFGEDITLAVDNVIDAIQGSGYDMHERCGFHLHIDVSAFTVEQLLTFTCVVAIAENALFRYVGVERRENIYCLPMQSTETIIAYYNSIKYGQTRDVLANIRRCVKYNAFNILPIAAQGSIEFRHHPATDSKEVILRWVNIIQHLRLVGEMYNATDLVNRPCNELQDIIFGRFKDLLLPNGWTDEETAGWVVAKDILNLGQLEERWNTMKDVYSDVNRITLREDV